MQISVVPATDLRGAGGIIREVIALAILAATEAVQELIETGQVNEATALTVLEASNRAAEREGYRIIAELMARQIPDTNR